MGTLFDYVRWRGDLTFDEAPVNEVDLLIFSLITYFDFSGIVPEGHGESPVSLQSAANAFFSTHPTPKKANLGFLFPSDFYKLFRAIHDTRRFRNVEMCGFVNEVDHIKEMQFSAVTLLLNQNEFVVAYRGTDDNLVSWKEDLKLSFLPVIPAQARAAEYLNSAAQTYQGNIHLTGHSKGGNLSIYAGVRCAEEVRPRISGIWNFDGPGFSNRLLSDPAYQIMEPKIHSMIPQSSIIGILLDHDPNTTTIVQSRQMGILQHDATTWSVMGGNLIHLPKSAGKNQRNDKMLNAWIQDMTIEQREQFTDAFFQVLSSGNATTLTDLASPKNMWLLRSMKLDKDVRKIVVYTIRVLVQESSKGMIKDLFKIKRRKKKELSEY